MAVTVASHCDSNSHFSVTNADEDFLCVYLDLCIFLCDVCVFVHFNCFFIIIIGSQEFIYMYSCQRVVLPSIFSHSVTWPFIF